MGGVPERVLLVEQVAAFVVAVGVGAPAAVGDAQRQRPVFGVINALAAAQRVDEFVDLVQWPQELVLAVLLI